MLDYKRREKGMQNFGRKLGTVQLRCKIELVTSTAATLAFLLPDMMHCKLRLDRELVAEVGLDKLPQIGEAGEAKV
jgi:hypothetical protein